MGMFVNPDNSAFQVALNSEIYVDKSGLIKYTNRVLNTLQGYICNSRPRRFGKSVTANMLTAYYSRGCNSEAMFADLEISKSTDFKKHLNQYDVIHLDIQWCMEPAGGPENVVSYITEKTILELRNYYPEILPDSISSLPEALSCINTATGQKFVVIIDEWDVLIRDEAHNQAAQEMYIDFLRNMFKGIEASKYIALAYLTGILPIKKLKTQSALNNFMQRMCLDPRFYTGVALHLFCLAAKICNILTIFDNDLIPASSECQINCRTCLLIVFVIRSPLDPDTDTQRDRHLIAHFDRLDIFKYTEPVIHKLL